MRPSHDSEFTIVMVGGFVNECILAESVSDLSEQVYEVQGLKELHQRLLPTIT